jgi:hypothetical protein
MWTRVPANPGMGMEAQDLLRWGGAPVASVKKRLNGESQLPPRWECSLLVRSGTSTMTIVLGLDMSIEDVKARCEMELEELGWTRAGNPVPKYKEEEDNVDTD